MEGRGCACVGFALKRGWNEVSGCPGHPCASTALGHSNVTQEHDSFKRADCRKVTFLNINPPVTAVALCRPAGCPSTHRHQGSLGVTRAALISD